MKLNSLQIYLNTSHVNVNHIHKLSLVKNWIDLNTSHVNVNLWLYPGIRIEDIHLNTSHVNVNQYLQWNTKSFLKI